MSLSNINRLRTKKIISLFPGVHLRLLQRMTQTSFNTTRYHVRNLELAGEIVCTKDGGHDRLFPVGLPERQRAVSALLLDRTTRKIVESLLTSGGLCNAEIADATKTAKSTVSEHIDSLRKEDIVKRVVSLDGTVTYELRDKEEMARQLSSFQASMLASAADRFVELWDI